MKLKDDELIAASSLGFSTASQRHALALLIHARSAQAIATTRGDVQILELFRELLWCVGLGEVDLRVASPQHRACIGFLSGQAVILL